MGIALRRRGLAERVIGIGRRQVSLDKALEVGAIDECTLDLAEGVKDADLVVLATPIRAIVQLAPDIAAAMKQGAVLTEVSSTKQQVIESIRKALTERDDVPFVPTHPMAGSEQHGPLAAAEDLFEASVCIFTPLPGTPASALDGMRSLWEALGARIHEMEPARHDRIVAVVSHTPHLAAAAIARTVSEKQGQFAGGGFIDTTRIASGDPRLWRDICESNPAEVCRALDALIHQLLKLRQLFETGRYDGIQQYLQDAKDKRDGILELRDEK
jgi:prephenate dehydrogenase